MQERGCSVEKRMRCCCFSGILPAARRRALRDLNFGPAGSLCGLEPQTCRRALLALNLRPAGSWNMEDVFDQRAPMEKEQDGELYSFFLLSWIVAYIIREAASIACRYVSVQWGPHLRISWI